jgi:hypothetical protein
MAKHVNGRHACITDDERRTIAEMMAKGTSELVGVLLIRRWVRCV